MDCWEFSGNKGILSEIVTKKVLYWEFSVHNTWIFRNFQGKTVEHLDS